MTAFVAREDLGSTRSSSWEGCREALLAASVESDLPRAERLVGLVSGGRDERATVVRNAGV